MLHKFFPVFKEFSKRFRLRWYLPFVVLIGYTILGAYIFRRFELEPDLTRRQSYRNATDYAFNQVLKRMLEIRCTEREGVRFNNNLQIRHTKDAMFWFLDYMNLTEIVEERSDMNSPWSWMGALFFAGQLYTTVGYGLPAAATTGGRVASIIYIMFGIPIFLIFLKDVGELQRQGLNKLFKRIRSAKKKLPAGRRMSAPVKAFYHMSISPLALIGANVYNTMDKNKLDGEEDPEKGSPEATKKSAVEAAPAPPHGILKKPAENGDLDVAATAKKKPSKDDKKNHDFPVSLALTILVIWILLSSALFCLWEKEWGFFTSVYFFFVSISTVGLGDIVPSNRDMMFVNFALILIGLALLSMVLTVIQNAIEKFVSRLLEDYIKEFEKMAEIVNTTEDFTEESLKPFEVEMIEPLTAPLTAISPDEHRGPLWGLARTAKDWVAEQVAENLLIKKLCPPSYDSDSSTDSTELASDEEDEDDEEETEDDGGSKGVDELKEVLVTGGGSVGGDEQRSTNGDIQLPPTANLLAVRKTSQISTSTRETMPATAAAKDNVSRSSVKARKKEKKHRSHLRQFNPFFNYNAGTLRAIQMIETAKLRTDRNSDFRSRLFAKFATNTRLAKLIDEKPHPPTKMVSFSVQTSPIVEQREKKSARMSYGIGLGSMDSMSSGLNQNTGNDTSTMKSFDIDSLCSSAYYDVAFHGYRDENVSNMIVLNTPPTSLKAQNSVTSHKSSLNSKPSTPPHSAPIIKLDRTSGSPPQNAIADQAGRQQRRRYSTANCLPIPTSSSDRMNELPLINSRMPLTRCPSCSNVSAESAPEPKTIQRVHEICGIMPSDFLHHTHKPHTRPDSSASQYEDSSTLDHSFHRHSGVHASASSMKSNEERASHIPVRQPLRRSRRLEDSGIAADESIVEAQLAHGESPLLDSGVGDLAKTSGAAKTPSPDKEQ